MSFILNFSIARRIIHTMKVHTIMHAAASLAVLINFMMDSMVLYNSGNMTL
jgi:hypothetical protein